MNLVSVLIAPAIVTFTIGDSASEPIRIAIAVVATLIIIGAVVVSKRRGTSIADSPAESVSNGAA
jgi:K(+)-stimulated pyrophosphate-energized sodium pump